MNEYNKAETNSGRENKLVVISGERGREMSRREKEIQDVINKTNMMQQIVYSKGSTVYIITADGA